MRDVEEANSRAEGKKLKNRNERETGLIQKWEKARSSSAIQEFGLFL